MEQQGKKEEVQGAGQLVEEAVKEQAAVVLSQGWLVTLLLLPALGLMLFFGLRYLKQQESVDKKALAEKTAAEMAAKGKTSWEARQEAELQRQLLGPTTDNLPPSKPASWERAALEKAPTAKPPRPKAKP